MYHMRQATSAEWSAWGVIQDLDGVTRPADAQELLNRGVVIAHTDPVNGDVHFHVGKLDPPQPGEFPGVVLTPVEGPDAYLSRRYKVLPAEHKAKFYQARVYRSLDGSSLRESCEAAVLKSLAARTPATGRTSSLPADPGGALAVLEEAKRRASLEVPTAQVLTLPMSEVRLGDVVEEDVLIGHRWAGEPDS